MTITYQSNCGRFDRVSLIECPAPGCDQTWEVGDSAKRSVHFFKHHLPEDFGLTPLGEVPDR